MLSVVGCGGRTKGREGYVGRAARFRRIGVNTGMLPEERLQAIVDCSLFHKLDSQAQLALARMASVRVYRTGEALFRRGDRSGTLFLVCDGWVRLALDRGAKEFSLSLHSRGDVLAEHVLLGVGYHESDCLAITHVRVLRFVSVAISEAILNDLWGSLNARMAQRVQLLLERVEDLSLHTLDTRLARLLCRLSAQRVPLPYLSQGVLASMANASRTKMNQMLRRFQRLGVIEMRGGRIIAVDGERLLMLCDDTGRRPVT
ncbi:transcriptional regulator [Pseudomonas aeruginosa]|nr:transcriptional regulator [Pseudomonas aeruginosa]